MLESRFSLLAVAVTAALSGHAIAQNDDCTGAVFANQGANGPYTNASATTSAPAWPCGFGGADLWFLYVAPGSGSLTADTCGASFDTVLEIFHGTGGCGAATSLGCSDDFCGVASSLTVPVTIGTTYYIRVGGYGSDTGTFPLNISGPMGTGAVATATSVGLGCIRKFTSVYEAFASAASFDLSNSALTLFPTGPGYVAVPIGTYHTPGGGAIPLALGDDDEVTQTLGSPFNYDGGSTTSLTICSNGFVSVASGNGTGFDPVIAELLDAPETGWWVWHDMDPSSGGTVSFEEVGSMTYVTWDGVIDYSSNDTNTFQLQFDRSSGSVAFVWQTMSMTGDPFLVGYSPGGNSANPGSLDISAALAGTFSTFGVDLLPLTMLATSRPVTGTNWGLSANNIPATGVIGVEILGLSNPNIPDLTAIGMPTCGLYTSLDLLSAFAVAGPSHAWSLALPNTPSLVSQHVFASAAVFQVPAVNPFGAISSNGIDGLIGNL